MPEGINNLSKGRRKGRGFNNAKGREERKGIREECGNERNNGKLYVRIGYEKVAYDRV